MEKKPKLILGEKYTEVPANSTDFLIVRVRALEDFARDCAHLLFEYQHACDRQDLYNRANQLILRFLPPDLAHQSIVLPPLEITTDAIEDDHGRTQEIRTAETGPIATVLGDNQALD